MSLAGWMRGFIDLNRRACQWIERRLPAGFLVNLHRSYEAEAARLINNGSGRLILDIGGGKACPYIRFLDKSRNNHVVAIDIAEEELRQNTLVQHRIVADAVWPLPIADGSADILSSRSVMEHIRDNRTYIGNCAGTLKDGGYLIQSFPCRFAPFAIANRLLPDRLARAILFYLHPEWQNECGFKAFYDRCYPSAIIGILRQNGFEIVHRELRYYQSIYYTFFLPLYLVMTAYDLLTWSLGLENLCCQMLFIARKHAPATSSTP